MLWAAGVLVRGSEAIWRFLFRRRSPVSGDPAEELRRKLAEAREPEDEPEPAEQEAVPPPAQEVPEPEPEPPPAAADNLEPAADDLESLRRTVHARARELTEEMRGPSEGD
jgi:hypothetical protein